MGNAISYFFNIAHNGKIFQVWKFLIGSSSNDNGDAEDDEDDA